MAIPTGQLSSVIGIAHELALEGSRTLSFELETSPRRLNEK